MVRALLFGIARVLAALATAIGLGFDFSGISLFGLSSDGLRIMILIAFASFFVLTVWREIELFLLPRPRIQFDEVSYASARTILAELRYFVRLAFRNKAKNPSGGGSTAQNLTASISIFDKGGKLVDSWEGRWANKDEPASYGDIWHKNRFILPANNQQAILDIGFRIYGEMEFQGHDNFQFFGVGQPRVRLPPGTYHLKVTLAASNIKEKDFWFSLNFSEEVQSYNLKQVNVRPIQKPAISIQGKNNYLEDNGGAPSG